MGDVIASYLRKAKGVLDFIERYTVDDDKRDFISSKKSTLKVKYLYYDWNLNA